MKILIIMFLLTGCASAPSYEERTETIMNQVELSGFYRHGFCDGKRLLSYFESTRYVLYSCENGGSFMLPKE